MIGVILGFDYPTTCKGCKLFVNAVVGYPAFCSAGGRYTEKEIEKDKNGNIAMYYNGCLSHRPKNCPLKELFLDDEEEGR